MIISFVLYTVYSDAAVDSSFANFVCNCLVKNVLQNANAMQLLTSYQPTIINYPIHLTLPSTNFTALKKPLKLQKQEFDRFLIRSTLSNIDNPSYQLMINVPNSCDHH